MNNVEESDRDILVVSIFTFLTVLSWVSFQLIQTAKTTTVKSPLQQIIQPLDPTLRTTVLETLKERQIY